MKTDKLKVWMQEDDKNIKRLQRQVAALQAKVFKEGEEFEE